MTRPTFSDAVRSAPVRLRDGRQGHLVYYPSLPRPGWYEAKVQIGDDVITVHVDDLEVIGDV